MKIIPLFLVSACLTAPFTAAENYAFAKAAETNVFLGQVFNIDIVVKAEQQPDTPPLDESGDFNLTLNASGPTAGETNTWFYRIAARAVREGQLTFPPLKFGSLQTDAIRIDAIKPQSSDRMKLKQTLSKKEVFAGEPVVLETTWDTVYPFASIKAVDLNFPVLNDPRFQVLEMYEPGKESKEQTTGLPVHGTRVLASRNSFEADGEQHQSLTFSKILIPEKSGSLTIPSATLLCAAEKLAPDKKPRRPAFQYPAYFDNTFFDQNVAGENYDRIFTEAAPLTLIVKPLPSANRPELFNGMVGDFTITAEAEPTAVRVGEPITLTIKITSKEHLENIQLPPLRYQPLLVNRFEIPVDRALPQRSGKTKIYTQTLRALSADQTEIPPIQLAYFSPASNAFITAVTAPIPLNVSPAEAVGIFSGGHFQSQLRAAEGGIRHNYENPDMLKSRPIPLFGCKHPALVFALLFTPPLLVIGVGLTAFFGEKKHHIHRTAKAARAFKVFKRNTAHIARNHALKAEIYGDLDEILRAYLGDRLHLNPGALSFREAELKMAKADPADIEKLRQLFAVCEAYRFTEGYDETADARAIVKDAVQTVKALERSLK